MKKFYAFMVRFIVFPFFLSFVILFYSCGDSAAAENCINFPDGGSFCCENGESIVHINGTWLCHDPGPYDCQSLECTCRRYKYPFYVGPPPFYCCSYLPGNPYCPQPPEGCERPQADFNEDGQVTIEDAELVEERMGARFYEPMDMNRDNVITEADVQIVKLLIGDDLCDKPNPDLNQDHVVNVLDLIDLLLEFGYTESGIPSNNDPNGLVGDIDDDGLVGVEDLEILLLSFGISNF